MIKTTFCLIDAATFAFAYHVNRVILWPYFCLIWSYIQLKPFILNVKRWSLSLTIFIINADQSDTKLNRETFSFVWGHKATNEDMLAQGLHVSNIFVELLFAAMPDYFMYAFQIVRLDGSMCLYENRSIFPDTAQMKCVRLSVRPIHVLVESSMKSRADLRHCQLRHLFIWIKYFPIN